MKALDITDTRQLEDLCINTIYASLLAGKLSPQTQTFEISSVTARDLPPSQDYTGMITTLSQWSKQCDLVLAEISDRIKDVRNTETIKLKEEEEYEKEVEKARGGSGEGGKAAGLGKSKGKGKERTTGHGIREGGEAMGEDNGGNSPVRRKRKSPGGS
jgi:COP9 signalosome complex subunit 7